jgi:hypothetical protein
VTELARSLHGLCLLPSAFNGVHLQLNCIVPAKPEPFNGKNRVLTELTELKEWANSFAEAEKFHRLVVAARAVLHPVNSVSTSAFSAFVLHGSG